jgi:hypothetical protein
MMNIRKTALLLIFSGPFFGLAQKIPHSLNLFRVTYVLDGKVKDLDTNFKIRVYNHDSLLCVTQASSMMVESYDGKGLERISSLVRIPVIKLNPSFNLIAEIEIGKEIIRWNANIWEYQDSLKFYDSFGLHIYKYSNPKKFAKPSKGSYGDSFRGETKAPAKEEFPFIQIGWQLEEIEVEMEVVE